MASTAVTDPQAVPFNEAISIVTSGLPLVLCLRIHIHLKWMKRIYFHSHFTAGKESIDFDFVNAI